MREIDLTVEKAIRPEGRRPIRPRQEGAFPMLRWAALHYGWIVVALAVAGGLLGARFPAVTGGGDYQAEAVVNARGLEIEAESLPQTAAAIFNAGAVSRVVADQTATGIPPNELIPDVIRLEPVENTVVMRVVAVHTDPETAAELANIAAEALVEELQRLGTGVGRFAVHTPAAVPAEPTEGAPIPPEALGALAGLLFGLGVVGLILSARRPVIGPNSLATALAHPVTGSLSLSSVDATGDLRFVPQLGSTVSALFPNGDERRFLVGVHVRRRVMRVLAAVMARTLARSRRAALVGRGVTRLEFGTPDEKAYLMVNERTPPTAGVPTVVLGRFLPDDTEALDPDDGWVLVVGRGASLHKVQRAAADLEGFPLAGVVFIRPLGLGDVARRQDPQRA